MSPQTEHIIREIQQLPAAEQERIYEWLEENKSVTPTTDVNRPENEAILRHLLSDGLIEEIAAQMSDSEDAAYELMDVGGEPLSEAIIRERR